jgi:hypothetical protein
VLVAERDNSGFSAKKSWRSSVTGREPPAVSKWAISFSLDPGAAEVGWTSALSSVTDGETAAAGGTAPAAAVAAAGDGGAPPAGAAPSTAAAENSEGGASPSIASTRDNALSTTAGVTSAALTLRPNSISMR